MCGRLAQLMDQMGVEAFFGATPEDEATWRTTYNGAPSQDLVVVRRRAGATTWRTMRWGLQAQWVTSGPRPINARAETVRRGAMFRRAFSAR